MPQAKFVKETLTVKRIARDIGCRWVWTRHFFEEAAKEEPPITQPDVENAILHGTVTLVEYHKEEKFRVVGPDLDGRSIVAIVVAYAAEIKLKVITVFTPGRS